MAISERSRAFLDSVLNPGSVAVLGASDNPSRIGGRPLSYILEAGFQGPVYPVNPNRPTVQGLTAYPSIDAVPGPVDFVIVALPAAQVIEAVEACAAKGVKACVIFSSGFAEMGEAGAAAQGQLGEIARRTGMRLLGPNCLGVFNAANGLFATFTTTLDRGIPKPGHIGMVSQSGAYGSHLYYLCRLKGLGVRSWITTGNECDVSVAEGLLALAEDDHTETIIAYAEGVTDGPLLMQAFETARRNGKPVAFMKVGRSAVGAEAASSHTAALAGADRVYDTVFRQFGVHRARTTEELIDIAYATTKKVYPAGHSLGLVTISGGAGVLMADAASDQGFEVPPLPEPAQAKLKALLPYASPRNPVDITAQAFNQMDLVSRNMEIMLGEGGYDAVLAFFTSVAGSTLAEPLRAAMREGIRGFEDRLIALSIIAPEAVVKAYESDGMLVFEDPTRALVALRALCRFGESFARRDERPAVEPAAGRLPAEALDERRSKAILEAAGLPVLADRLAADAEAAVAAAGALGYPVVLKIVSPDILHKTEVGGIRVGLGDAEAVRRGFAEILESVRAKRPEARIEGVMVVPMAGGGVETILGVQRDPVFGPVVLFGLGGIFTEVLEDVSLRVAPFGREEALRMIHEIRGVKLLQGARGAPPADIGALADALVALGRFAAAHAGDLETCELNPLLVRPEGQGCVALDALLVGRSPAAE
ncbi:Acyl-CoA synthetase (NDP forming) [Tistlia consotensis]|uniref:Acyl-CoA synthetase (NDP forming) n=1 Tax=Tistlia consotensis USBA 355 TaxID=560819 RepID=A0A1Y6C0L8_9PROT|nr:acetate--CoA ligase family protein [Tistlia consotensis]SMF30213.1 Acyl-CoA synthetase (NDP forming) [Tistlia consotensis USBA 355]SNR90283.1 Acyl-CoA synthetase (NDP forming) [Tistlia consotensis]